MATNPCRKLTVTTKADVGGPQLPTLARTVMAPFRAIFGKRQADYVILNDVSGVLSPVSAAGEVWHYYFSAPFEHIRAQFYGLAVQFSICVGCRVAPRLQEGLKP
jgi:hypothetical protein